MQMKKTPDEITFLSVCTIVTLTILKKITFFKKESCFILVKAGLYYNLNIT